MYQKRREGIEDRAGAEEQFGTVMGRGWGGKGGIGVGGIAVRRVESDGIRWGMHEPRGRETVRSLVRASPHGW